jgi:small subunit ribosomal protein S17e
VFGVAAARRALTSLDRARTLAVGSENSMGRVRTKLIKRAARSIVEKYYSRLTFDFDTNKRTTDEVAQVPSKRVRNKIAGYVTHLMKRIQKGPVRGISLKLQEQERERRMDFAPERSVLDVEKVAIDPDTANLLKSLDFGDLGGVTVDAHLRHGRRDDRPRGPRRDRPQGENRGPRRPRPPKGQAGPAGAAGAPAAAAQPQAAAEAK